MQTQVKKINEVTWINIVKPEILEIKKILLENNLNDSLAEEIVRPTATTKVDTMRSSVYLTLHFPIWKNEKMISEEVDFLIKNNLLITSSYNEILFLKDYVQNLNLNNMKTDGGNVFSEFMHAVYKQIESDGEKTAGEIKELEENIFEMEERKVIEDVSKISKKNFAILNKLKLHFHVLEIFSKEANKIFGFEFDPTLENLKTHLQKVIGNMEYQKGALQELKDTFDFLLTNKTNQIVKVFTVISFVLLPMTFLAAFFGMNTRFPTELVSSDYGTVYIMLIMFTISTATVLYLHFKKFI